MGFFISNCSKIGDYDEILIQRKTVEIPPPDPIPLRSLR